MLEYREALELFRYDYETGVLYWRWRINNRVPKTLEAIYLGIFDTLEGTAEARRQADRKYKFNNNHGEGRAEYVRKKANARLSK